MEIVMIILGVVNLTLLAYVLVNLNKKEAKVDFSEITEKLVKTDTKVEILSKKIDELQPKIASEFRENRKEISGNLGEIQKTVDTKITRLQDSNEKKLEQMRETVDEKLQASVEKRFDESFKLLSNQLTQVHQGLGEMKTLQTTAGDLKKVMEGVKTRGVYGEVQLGAIISDILPRNLFYENVATRKGSNDRVEYAIKMPGKKPEILLPIDSKFPMETYSRLLSAYDSGRKEEIEKYRKELSKDVKIQAKKISEKYISEPDTTSIAVMFVPTESLFAEIQKIPSLAEEISRKYDITIASPSTLPVLLNAIRMGYSNVAMGEKSEEIRRTLGMAKSQFEKFGDLLDGVQKKLTEGANKIENAKTTSRQIEKTLKNIDVIDSFDSTKQLTE